MLRRRISVPTAYLLVNISASCTSAFKSVLNYPDTPIKWVSGVGNCICWALTLKNIFSTGWKGQQLHLFTSVFMLMLEGYTIFTYIFSLLSSVFLLFSNYILNMTFASCYNSPTLPVVFYICSYFVYAYINIKSASAMWSICLQHFSLPDRQTVQTFVSSQEQKLYCG